jgi:hypothetical protein
VTHHATQHQSRGQTELVVPANVILPKARRRVCPDRVGSARAATAPPHWASALYCTPTAPSIAPETAGAIVLDPVGGRGGVLRFRTVRAPRRGYVGGLTTLPARALLHAGRQRWMDVIDLAPPHEELYCQCLEDWSADIREAGDHKRAWYAKMRDRGLRVKLAVDDAGEVGSMIQYVPIQYAPASGKDLFFINCIWVHGHQQGRGNFQKRGMGKALLEAAEDDAWYRPRTFSTHPVANATSAESLSFSPPVAVTFPACASVTGGPPRRGAEPSLPPSIRSPHSRPRLRGA